MFIITIIIYDIQILQYIRSRPFKNLKWCLHNEV